jgi:flagellar basal body-associated protein FliL
MEEQQPQKKSSALIWILIILILLAIGVGIWFFLSKGNLPILGGSSIPQPPALPTG